MAVLDILKYPDARLHRVAERVPVVDDRIRKLVADMAETMYAAPGIGLAATQVNVHERVVVIDITETHDQLQVFINPEITWSSDTLQSYEEGCLSIPGIYDKVERPDAVTVTALDLDGKPFTMWKFRSMYIDSDARRASVVKAGGDAGNEVMFKDRQDPRITRVGRWIRRLSIDELPQLINVVRGDMSLVGPRPALPVEVAKYDAEALRRLLVKPGLTGLWQISGRSDLSWASTVALDRHYVENRGGALDAKIFAGTLRAVIGGKGAY